MKHMKVSEEDTALSTFEIPEKKGEEAVLTIVFSSSCVRKIPPIRKRRSHTMTDLDVYDRALLRPLVRVGRPLTMNFIAEKHNISWNAAKDHLKKLLEYSG